MAVAWTTIPNAQVAAGAAVTTALMTALRDNPEGVAQRALGAPKIFGNPYDYQEFLSAGTWTKPANAESGDLVLIHVVGGGCAGIAGGGQGGGGGAGFFLRLDDIDQLAATASITVGAGGVTSGQAGGASSFNDGGKFNLGAEGGTTSTTNPAQPIWHGVAYDNTGTGAGNDTSLFVGGLSVPGSTSYPSVYGGGAGGATSRGVAGRVPGGLSGFAGAGGEGTAAANPGGIGVLREQDGLFPGGGGGSVDPGSGQTHGVGAQGVVRVWCIKEG